MQIWIILEMASQTLDDFLPNVVTQDTRKRLQAYEKLVPYLENERSSLYCEETDKFVDGLAGWINSSNYKVTTVMLENLTLYISAIACSFLWFVGEFSLYFMRCKTS